MKSLKTHHKKVLLLIGIVAFFSFFFFLKNEARAFYVDTGIQCVSDIPCPDNPLEPGKHRDCHPITHTCWEDSSLPSSMNNFQKEIQDCKTTGSMNLSCYFGGTELADPGGSTGVLGAILGSALTGMGGANWVANSGESYYTGGVIGGISSAMGFLITNPPASTMEYLADLGNSLGIAKPIYAQDTGFTKLQGILPIWKSFRNIAYMFLTLIFLAIGLAIMFRVKIDPKTVVTIQSAIPKIVITLILITFSYAIAGLLIDFMSVVGALATGVINPDYLKPVTDLFNIGPVKVGDWLSSTLGLKDIGANPNIFVFLFLYLFKGFGYAQTLTDVVNPPAFIANILNAPRVIVTAIETITTFIGGSGLAAKILAFVMTGILLFAFIKLFITLLKCYVTIIISIIFSPLQIMLGALPGSQGFSGWFRNLVANMAVFPAVVVMLALTSRITNDISGGTFNVHGFWVPSPINPPFGIGSSARMTVALLAYGMLLFTAQVPTMVKSAFKMKEGKGGFGIGEAFGPLKGVWSTGKAAAQKGAVSWAAPRVEAQLNRTFPGRGVPKAAEEKTTEQVIAKVGTPPKVNS